MREIKFRMWDFANGEMIDGDSLAFEEYAPIKHLLSQEGIMQYTGLKDKNGKEIYEGDILKGKRFVSWASGEQRIIGKVVYRPCSFQLDGVGKYEGLNCEEFNSLYEIIGNIYENSELLEVRA